MRGSCGETRLGFAGTSENFLVLVDDELDQEIPAELYEAVAEVLKFVYELSGRQG